MTATGTATKTTTGTTTGTATATVTRTGTATPTATGTGTGLRPAPRPDHDRDRDLDRDRDRDRTATGTAIGRSGRFVAMLNATVDLAWERIAAGARAVDVLADALRLPDFRARCVARSGELGARQRSAGRAATARRRSRRRRLPTGAAGAPRRRGAGRYRRPASLSATIGPAPGRGPDLRAPSAKPARSSARAAATAKVLRAWASRKPSTPPCRSTRACLRTRRRAER